jgi:hypothetical protein
MNVKGCVPVIVVLLFVAAPAFPQDHDLQYFLAKISSKEMQLSRAERADLIAHIDRLLERAQGIRTRLIQGIQTGEIDIRYQEGKFWATKLEEDGALIDTGLEQAQLLKDNPALLVSSIRLYRSLKDLSASFNACNNISLFSAQVGDLAPELELWADPVFYELHLLPLARLKEKEPEPKPVSREPPPAVKEKPPVQKGKTPPPPKSKKP